MFADHGFYKRAQIVASDLALAGVAEFDDLDRLTIFADNLVPHVLRSMVYWSTSPLWPSASTPERSCRSAGPSARSVLAQCTPVS